MKLTTVVHTLMVLAETRRNPLTAEQIEARLGHSHPTFKRVIAALREDGAKINVLDMHEHGETPRYQLTQLPYWCLGGRALAAAEIPNERKQR